MEQTTFWTDFKRFAGRSYLGTFVAGLALGMLASGSPLALLAMVIVGSAWHAHARARRQGDREDDSSSWPAIRLDIAGRRCA